MENENYFNFIITGANWGDEGKGHVANWLRLVNSSAITKQSMIGIKHNGGPQMGHTSNGHVWHTYCSADIKTYLHSSFIFNPFSFNKETMDLTIKFQKVPYQVYIHSNCRITTPIDILINHVIETKRSKGKHGSCGMGIHATIERDKTLPLTVFEAMYAMTDINKQEFTKKLITYYKGFEYAIRDIPEQFQNLDYEHLMQDFWKECEKASADLIMIKNDQKAVDLLNEHEFRIFEGGQGLMLDRDNEESYPYVTPSKTDSTNPVQILSLPKMKIGQIFPLYISRIFTTKHGAGPFPLEIKKKNKLIKLIKSLDKTNIPNEWQDSIRIGAFDESIIDRIKKDFDNYEKNFPSLKNTISPELIVTWNDISPTKREIINKDGEFYDIKEFLLKCYTNGIHVRFLPTKTEYEIGLFKNNYKED